MARSLRRHFVPFVVLLLLISCAIGAADAPMADAGPDRMIYLGAWVGEQVNIPGDVAAFEQAIGKPLSIVHRFSSNPPYMGSRFDSDWADSVRAAGSIPMLSWDPFGDSGVVSLAGIAAGDNDQWLAGWADQFRGWGHPIFVRMMWEQNGPWFPWRADTEPQTSDFIAAWRHVVTLFRDRGATNATFVWSPNVSGTASRPIMESYPGDGYVDWVSLDGYPNRGGHGDFYETFKPDYDILIDRVAKPIMIGEISLEDWSDLAKAAEVRDILTVQLPVNFPAVKAFVWFDEKKSTNGLNYSILTAQGPNTRQAFRQSVSSPYFTSNAFGRMNRSPIPVPEVAMLDAPPPTPTPLPGRPSLADLVGNRVANPGFEQEGATNVPPGWTASTALDSLFVDPIEPHSGYLSLRHESASGKSYTLYQDLTVTAGKAYNFLGWARVLSSTGYFTFGLQLQIIGTGGGTIKTVNLASIPNSPGGWQEIRVQDILMPSGAARGRIVMKLSSLRGAVCVDDLILAPSDVALPSLDATATPTGTATVTPTATATATATGTATATPSATQTVTVAPTYTSTSTRTATPGATVTNSVTPTTTATVTSTARAQTPTATPTYTPTIAATATSTPDPGNLLKNPSFEQKAGGLGVPPYWSVSSWATSKAWVVRGGVDDDGGALFLSGDGSSYAVFQDVPNLDGGVYRLSGWLSLPEISRGSMRLELAPLTRYGGPAGPPAWLSRSQPTGGWEYFEIDITGPPNLSKMRVQAKVEGMRGSAYLDGMQLRRVR